MELQDFNIPLRSGHVLSLVRATRDGAGGGGGPYIAAYNHNTHDMKFDSGQLVDIHGFRKLHARYRAGIILIPIVLFLLLPVGGEMKLILAAAWAFFGLLFGQIVGGIMARKAAIGHSRAFANGPVMTKLREALQSTDVSVLRGSA